MREIDEPIPDDEELYRTVGVLDCDGDRVLPHRFIDGAERSHNIIDADGTSVCRQKYVVAPTNCLTPLRPDENGLAMILAGNLPTPVQTPGGTVWEFRAVDVPEEDNDAHAEIRVRKRGTPEGQWARVKKHAQRLAIKQALAARFRVILPPT